MSSTNAEVVDQPEEETLVEQVEIVEEEKENECPRRLYAWCECLKRDCCKFPNCGGMFFCKCDCELEYKKDRKDKELKPIKMERDTIRSEDNA